MFAVRRLVSLAVLAALAAPASAEIIVGTSVTPGRYVVHADAAAGNAAPLRQVGGAVNSQLQTATSFGFNPESQELFVGDFQGQAIRVYNANANGDVAPLRTITSPGLGQPRDFIVDTAHDELIVIAFLSFVNTYPLSANGVVGASRQIERGGAQGSLTRIDNPTGIALVPSVDQIALGDYSQPGGVGDATGEILFFARTANGAGAPARDITGPATDLGSYVQSLALDASREELYALVGTQSMGETTYHIAVFDALASGNTPPLRVIRGDQTRLAFAGGLSYDAARDRLLVTGGYGSTNPRVMAFPRAAAGNVAPLDVIEGNATGIDQPLGVLAIDRDPLFGDSFE